jgi:tripartite-type tricarboxylate transporter receptor subunit TctC
MTLRLRCVFVALLGILAWVCGANAQNFPTRPITIIVPFPAGGPTDTIARIMGDHMKGTLGQTLIVENVTGAGSTIGTTRAVNAAPDGYTVYLGNWTSAVGAGALYNVPWHIVNDLTPIARLPASSLMIVGKTGVPAKDIKELIAWLKANPGKATVASVGAGSGAHICGLYFMEKTGTKFEFAQYRGGAPAMQDLVGNQIDLMCAEASQTLTHVRGGKMKAFVVMSEERWAPLPDVPTMKEVGLDMLWPFWHGLWGPKNLPKPIVDAINAAVVKSFEDPAVQKRISDLGMTLPPRDQRSPQAHAAYHKAEVDKWWPIIKSMGIKVGQ